MSRWSIATILCFSAALSGCSEGIFWKAGHYSPWAQEKWKAEEQQADTLFSRKRQLDTIVAQAKAGSTQERKEAAEQLKNTVLREPILLVKLHAIDLLPELPASESIDALKIASRDPDSRIRKAAIKSWQRLQNSDAILQLQEMIGSDTDVDVRLQATKALGGFSDPKAASALSLALSDTNPAIQFRATQSLKQITGEDIGADVAAWQTYLDNSSRQTTAAAKGPTIR